MSRVDDLPLTTAPTSGDAAPADEPEAPAGVQLKNFQPHSQTNAHGKGAIVFGLVFVAFGCAPLLAALDVLPVDESSFHAPRWFVGGIAVLFFVLPGLSLAVHGVRGLYRERRRRDLLARYPDQLWRGDHPWEPEGETRSGWSAVGRRLFQLVAFAAFLSPFHWLGFREEGARVFLLFMLLFDLVLLGLAWSLVLLVVRALRYGRTRLSYDRFPVHPGETLDVRFEMSRPRRFERLTFRLLCVADEYVGSGEHSRIVSWQLLERIVELVGDETEADGLGGVGVSFAIPSDAPGTKLGVRPPRYWVLIVRGTLPGADYHERFLVPVYERFAEEALAPLP